MACPASYTVVIIPLKTSLHNLHALRFYLWIKQLKDLEREKDSLWAGLEVLEQARLWYRSRLEENRTRRAGLGATAGPRAWSGEEEETWGGRGSTSCLWRSRMQRVNGSLGSVMSEPNVTSSSLSLPQACSDSALRWTNTVLGQEVSEKNRHISMLELERDRLLHELDQLQTC